MTDLTPQQMDRVHEVAAYAIGQFSRSPESMLTDSERSNPEFLMELRNCVFYCEGCGWYFDADERHEEDLCNHCFDNENAPGVVS